MLKQSASVILSEIKKSQSENKVSEFLLNLVNELIDNDLPAIKYRGTILERIPAYILSITDTQIRDIQEGIDHPPVYTGSAESPLLIINTFKNRCIADWYIGSGQVN